jgi:DNA-binding MarR family transcriptional regulator
MVKQYVGTRSKSSLVHVKGAIAALQRLAEVFQLRRAQLARDAGLTEAQYEVLEEIGSRPFMPSLFARRRESSAAAVSKVLRTLLDAGLVEAAIGEGDARRRSYRLTAAGGRVLEAVEASRRRAIDAVWVDLDPDDLTRFARFSDQLAERIEAYAGGARRSEPKRPNRRRGPLRSSRR